MHPCIKIVYFQTIPNSKFGGLIVCLKFQIIASDPMP